MRAWMGPLSGVLMLLCLVIAGCEGPGFVSYVIAGPAKVDALYTLEDRPTLVIVDDPEHLLGNVNYPAVVGANTGFHLKQNEILTEPNIISQDRLSVYAAEQGDRYASMPIDQIGQQLGAEWVIHVRIKSVDIQSKNTYYEPTAKLEVKVVDARTGARLFPVSEEAGMGSSNPPGHAMTVRLKSQTIEETRRYALPMLERSLAERIGLEVAQLFYKHVPPDAKT